MITCEKVKEVLSYNEITGEFSWLIKLSPRTKLNDKVGHDNNGYRAIGLFGKAYGAHRLAWLIMTGDWPKGEIDHINHDKADNRWVNLRDVSHANNNRNQTLRRDNKSGFNGVCWNEKEGAWKTQIKVNGKIEYLGSFKELEDAIKARKEANKKHGYHSNHGNKCVE